MADGKTMGVCAICGRPTSHFIVHAPERRDAVGELHSDPQSDRGKRYFCQEHLPHIHGEPLEDRMG